MVPSDHAAKKAVGSFRFGIAATDISTHVLNQAKQAVYLTGLIAPIPQTMRRRYLLRSKNPDTPLVPVCSELRAAVQFHQLNFLDKDFGFNHPFDVIFCRNVMIYFDKQLQERLVNRFASYLKPGGYLFIGHSESLQRLDTKVIKVGPSVYRRSP